MVGVHREPVFPNQGKRQSDPGIVRKRDPGDRQPLTPPVYPGSIPSVPSDGADLNWKSRGINLWECPEQSFRGGCLDPPEDVRNGWQALTGPALAVLPATGRIISSDHRIPCENLRSGMASGLPCRYFHDFRYFRWDPL